MYNYQLLIFFVKFGNISIFITFFCVYLLFPGFWKGGGHEMAEINLGGWHNYHQAENQSAH
jgi:hypothetical protein